MKTSLHLEFLYAAKLSNIIFFVFLYYENPMFVSMYYEILDIDFVFLETRRLVRIEDAKISYYFVRDF